MRETTTTTRFTCDGCGASVDVRLPGKGGAELPEGWVRMLWETTSYELCQNCSERAVAAIKAALPGLR
jgi:hypothetical protein